MQQRVGKLPRTLVVLLAMLVAAGASANAPGADGKAAPQPKTVRLAIDYDDGVQKVFPAVPWKRGQTVLDLLQWADKHPRGIELELSGTGSSAFVRGIDRLQNEGGGAAAKNWLYRLNGKLGQVGAGACELSAGDEVVWRFAIFKAGDGKTGDGSAGDN